MKRAKRTKQRGKLRSKLHVARVVLTEILIMAVGVLCCIMPMPWRIIVPMIIELRSILLKMRARLKEPLPHGGTLRGKLHVVRVILTEIIIMTVSVLCCVMPMPWRLIVPIIIGARSILIKAHTRQKEQLK